MGQNDLRVALEIEKESANHEGEMFYRYRIGDFKLWFSQDMEGNIFSVGLREEGKELEDFEINVYCNEEGREEKHVGYYPTEFQVRTKSVRMDIGEARAFARDLERACNVMEAVRAFFSSGKHFALYVKSHNVPHIKVSAMDYRGHVVCEEIYRESDKGKAMDVFLRSHPKYLDSLVSAEPVGFSIENEEEPEKVKDELISRECIMSEIVSFNVQHGRTYASMDDDWKKAWGIIADFGEEDNDLVSRAGLMDAVLSQFGCDLAYYGGDLRFIQEAIELSPAVEKPLEVKLADAAAKAASGTNKMKQREEQERLF